MEPEEAFFACLARLQPHTTPTLTAALTSRADHLLARAAPEDVLAVAALLPLRNTAAAFQLLTGVVSRRGPLQQSRKLPDAS